MCSVIINELSIQQSEKVEAEEEEYTIANNCTGGNLTLATMTSKAL